MGRLLRIEDRFECGQEFFSGQTTCGTERSISTEKRITRPTSRSISGRRRRQIEPLTNEMEVFHTQLLLNRH